MAGTGETIDFDMEQNNKHGFRLEERVVHPVHGPGVVKSRGRTSLGVVFDSGLSTAVKPLELSHIGDTGSTGARRKSRRRKLSKRKTRHRRRK